VKLLGFRGFGAPLSRCILDGLLTIFFVGAFGGHVFIRGVFRQEEDHATSNVPHIQCQLRWLGQILYSLQVLRSIHILSSVPSWVFFIASELGAFNAAGLAAFVNAIFGMALLNRHRIGVASKRFSQRWRTSCHACLVAILLVISSLYAVCW
jgi:hypothetical protein